MFVKYYELQRTRDGKKETFYLCGIPQKDSRGYFVKVGSWEANYWANVTVSKTLKKTLSNFKKRLNIMDGDTFEYIEAEGGDSYFFEKFLEVAK